MSFTSTLYLCPVLDLLLVNVPPEWQAEVRLGLQEALVNAAKHGNKLDPTKTIIVKFTVTSSEYSWVIVDQGKGFGEGYKCLRMVEVFLSCMKSSTVYIGIEMALSSLYPKQSQESKKRKLLFVKNLFVY